MWCMSSHSEWYFLILKFLEKLHSVDKNLVIFRKKDVKKLTRNHWKFKFYYQVKKNPFLDKSLEYTWTDMQKRQTVTSKINIYKKVTKVFNTFELDWHGKKHTQNPHLPYQNQHLYKWQKFWIHLSLTDMQKNNQRLK